MDTNGFQTHLLKKMDKIGLMPERRSEHDLKDQDGIQQRQKLGGEKVHG